MSKGIEEVQILIITFIVFLFFSISLVYADNNSNSDEKESEETQTTIHYQEKESPKQEEEITTFRYPKEKPDLLNYSISNTYIFWEGVVFRRVFVGKPSEEGNGIIINPIGIYFIFENKYMAFNIKSSLYINSTTNWNYNWSGESYKLVGDGIPIGFNFHFYCQNFIKTIKRKNDKILWFGCGIDFLIIHISAVPMVKTLINLPIKDKRFQIGLGLIINYRNIGGITYSFFFNYGKTPLTEEKHLWGISGGLVMPAQKLEEYSKGSIFYINTFGKEFHIWLGGYYGIF